jgi:hypothetical protein
MCSHQFDPDEKNFKEIVILSLGSVSMASYT